MYEPRTYYTEWNKSEREKKQIFYISTYIWNLDVQAGFRNGRGIRDQIAYIRWIIKKKKKWEFQKNIYFCFIDYVKAFDCVDHNKLWKILQETGIPDHITCLLRNLYAGKEDLDVEQQTGSK